MQVKFESSKMLEETDNCSSREIERGSFKVTDNVDVDAASEEKTEDELFNFETRKIRILRTLMVLVLFTCAVVVIVITHIIVSETSTKKMAMVFEDSAILLIEGFERQMNATVYATWALSSIITNRYKGMDIWPNATLPDFELQCVGLWNIARARTITFTPLVNSTTNRLSWEQYASEHADLIGSPSLVYRADNTSWIIADGIFRFENGDQVYDPGYNALSRYPYTLNPLWQVYPLENNDELIMMNGNTEDNVKRTRALDDMIHYAVPTLTAPLQLAQDTKTSPSTILMFPVFEANNDMDGAYEYFSYSSANVVGISGVAYSWDEIFDNILPNDIKGLICVLKASTGEESTFQVDGPVATYIGDGDLHDAKYDGMEISRYTSIAKVSDKLAIADYLVTYSLSIYPSQTYRNLFDTNTIRDVTLLSVFLFLFVTALFFLYDHLLCTMNINRLSYEAHSGNKIVNSLYPEGVRDRLLSMNIKNKSKKDSKSTVSTISTFLTFGTIQSSDNTISITSEPICDQFPSVSIVFADIPGFRSWSSAHSPHEMFSLLESVFGEFDRAAKNLGVFKVETIEDCYVAVAGLPDPRDDHAVVMAQFALECQRKFNQVIKSHKDIDAENLRLRCGLHSGSITAGILRGEKSRFQLFGDTMNTASRMESTGVPTKVQISEQTAELLIKAGKSSWFVPREEKITAKGKGLLQTHWLIPNVHIRKSYANRRVSFASRRFSNLTRQLKSTRNISIKSVTKDITPTTQTTSNFNSKIDEHDEQDKKQ